MEIVQKISKDPILGISREVRIAGFTINLDQELIQFYYQVRLVDDKGGVLMDKDGTPKWVIDNSYEVTVRTSDMKPVQVKDTETNELVDVKEPAYKNFAKLFEPFVELLKKYIKLDDEENSRFNF